MNIIILFCSLLYITATVVRVVGVVGGGGGGKGGEDAITDLLLICSSSNQYLSSVYGSIVGWGESFCWYECEIV